MSKGLTAEDMLRRSEQLCAIAGAPAQKLQGKVVSGSCRVGSGPCENEGEAASPAGEEARARVSVLALQQ